MEIKDKQFENLHKEIQDKEKKREKSFNKFVKTEMSKNHEKFMKWSSRREEAQRVKKHRIEDLEESSYNSYRKEIEDLKKRRREQARVAVILNNFL
jgi:3-keto-L-gulonate-6-phosphate decarboxylase